MVNINTIKIESKKDIIYTANNTREMKSFYYFEYEEKRSWSYGMAKYVLSYHDMHHMIISMGSIKIQNLFNKTYKMVSARNAYFETREDAEKALEWLKQKTFETTIVGEDVLYEAERQKRQENYNKRQEKVNKTVKAIAEKNIANFNQHIGKTITLPVHVGVVSELKVPVTLLGLTLDDELYYILETSLGEIKFYHNAVEFTDTGIKSKIQNYEPRIKISGQLKIDY